jgi:hypothetical protein
MTSLHGERYDRAGAENSAAVDPANPPAEGACVYRGKADVEEVQPEAMQQLFRRLTTLRHPNVARVRELSLLDEELTLVVDPVHGMPLSEYVATRACSRRRRKAGSHRGESCPAQGGLVAQGLSVLDRLCD